MGKYTGITADSAKHLQLDAGCFLRSFDISKTVEQQLENKLGITAGGGSFAAVPTIRQVEFDGKRGAVVGFEDIDEWQVTLTANVKEQTVNNIKMALAAADTATGGDVPSGYTRISGRDHLEESDYPDNIAWVGRLSGSQKPIIIVVKRPLATNGLSLTFADKSEGVTAMTLTGHYEIDDLIADDCKPPFDIYYPDVE